MHILTILSAASAVSAIALPRADPVPQPSITNMTYSGSACPENGLTFTLGPVNATASNGTSSTASLAFTLSNFNPSLGSFGASLRMCNAVSSVRVDKGWKVRVNTRGTTAAGQAQLPGKATIYFRGTYMFAEPPFYQSIGMLDVPGPLAGPFSRLLTPMVGNDKGVEGVCDGGETELDIEFQARAVDDMYSDMQERKESVAGAGWTLTTDVEVVRC